MTEERARYYAKNLAFNLGITFYVVRSARDEIYAVQVPSDDCEIPRLSGRLRTESTGNVNALQAVAQCVRDKMAEPARQPRRSS
jgi:hypothetical protein